MLATMKATTTMPTNSITAMARWLPTGWLVRSARMASMAWLMFACVAYGVFASSHWAIPQTIAGPIAAGKWTGLQNCLANFAGVAAPWITGFAVERTGHFFWAFAVCSAVVLVGAAAYAFLMGPVEPLQWPAREP